jgi:hypothetical protein
MDKGRCREIGNRDEMIGTCSQKQEGCKGRGYPYVRQDTCFKRKGGLHQIWFDYQARPITTDDMCTSRYAKAVCRNFSANANLSRSDDGDQRLLAL